MKESGASTKTLTYYYGTNGVIGFRYNGADYYYQKNLQGDVIAIYNASGVKQAEYQYDAWGKVLNVINCGCCSNIGTINPFRYRSYYYDVETNLYYLETRYYDPEVGRFINSDSLKYLGDGAELSNYNLFAYCGNNPVIGIDHEGTSWGDFWSKLKAVGEKFVEAAVVVAAVGGAALTIAAAVTGTVASGGAGAIAIPAAIAVAAECLAIATSAVAIVGSAAAIAGSIGENVYFDKPQRGIGGKGWRGDKTWKSNVKKVSEGGDVRNLDGGKPSESEAKDLIREANGTSGETHNAHYDDGINTHLYPHVHYRTASGIRSTIEIIMEILS